MRISLIRSGLIFATATCLSLGSALATTITVSNPSFEMLPPGGLPFGGCGPACLYSIDTIPGWTGGTGQFQPGTGYFNYIPDGVTVGFTNGPALQQTVGATVQNGSTYTLTVDIGHRTEAPTFGGLAGLLVGSTYVAAIGTDPGAGNWGTYTATFTGTSLNAGDAITIDLLFDGYQGDFDNVKLSSVSPVPEPGSLSLLGLGLTGLASIRQWRKKSA